MRNISKNGTSILFFGKKRIQSEFIRKHKTSAGYINVSSPELTAVDLIENEKSVGGLSRVCTVLNELVNAMDLNNLNDSFFSVYSSPVFQRLGYILEYILEKEDLAEILLVKMKDCGLKPRKVPFKLNKPTEGCKIEKKWKIIINQEIDIDE